MMSWWSNTPFSDARRPSLSSLSPSSSSFISDVLGTNGTAGDFVDGIVERIPLPTWAVYLLVALGALALTTCCVCVCCCRLRRRKRRQKPPDAPVLLRPRGGPADAEPAGADAGAGAVNSGAGEQPRGTLLYSLEFNAALSELTVGVKQASGLKAMDLGGTSDPYVKVYILPDKTKTCETKVLKNTLNATFNETFNFQISKATLLKSTAVLRVFDFDRFSRHDIIGELRLQLGEVDWNHVIEERRDLREPADTEEENLGEICFSLRYVPTSGKLTVVILEAKNLKSSDLDGSSDPYVKVQLALDKRKWKKKKTSVKKNTLNPYYNEAFVFKVTLAQIRRVNLVISVWDRDPMTPDDSTGKIFLGCDASGNGLRHWADMLANPRRPVAQWHTLLSAQQVNGALALKKKMPF
ncbi:synaptotagmin VIII [Syngnathoides biaculeatus]|uniref:synaptotagmin VIII n=1 Tax=Syngnathoides biaculeatus TaxID=300417 RepID=UPI002ADE88D7|nr:synaptotagmin VIII [Syngnathoides biaculeatus]XP_061696626.1 synaptotagmin VIII [Syngnathoides biaculeatus]